MGKKGAFRGKAPTQPSFCGSAEAGSGRTSGLCEDTGGSFGASSGLCLNRLRRRSRKTIRRSITISDIVPPSATPSIKPELGCALSADALSRAVSLVAGCAWLGMASSPFLETLLLGTGAGDAVVEWRDEEREVRGVADV